ncbi:MAG: immune inhibitor A [Ignavibacterium sp.]|jgi:murein tripeptide amidase MpaA|uniref:M14 family zinc carboxypeptidase n=1 Tax=Ignavibacterium sp. TaxID=2651167 RepID=UPI00329933A3
MKYLVIILSFVVSINLSSQNYKQVKINLSDENNISELIKLQILDDHFAYEKNNSVVCFISESEFDKLRNSGFSYEILIDDWFEHYRSFAALSESEKNNFITESKEKFNVDGFGFGSMGGYYTFNEIVVQLDSMYNQFPNIITQKFQIGTSQQGRPIWAVKISDNPNVSENESKVGYDALIHAREPQSMASMMYFMWYLLQNYGTDSEVTYLVDNREMFFVPCFNPDGYEYNRQTNPNGGGMWRKNRRNNGDGSYGVDLNRNFGYMFAFDDNGSSPIPSDETYRGPFAFSEPESQAVRDFAILNNYKTHFNLHSYQNAFLYPWGYINALTPDSAIYHEFASDMSGFNQYVYGNSGQILGYNSNGSVKDWMYGEQITKQKTFGYTVEIGSTSDGFWPPQSRIFPLAQGMLRPNLYNAWVAGDYVALNTYSFSQQYFNPGDNVQLNILTVKNKGLSDAANIVLQLGSDEPEITITNSLINVGSVPARTVQTVNQSFSFTVGNLAPETEVNLLITSIANSLPIRVDTIKIVIGTPVLLFADTTNNINTLWNLTATPSTPIWGTTTSTFVSAPNSYTDSPTGNYTNNATVTMTSKNPIDLSSYSNPKLKFYTKFDIENNYDYGQVEISTNNGTSWIPLQGMYTNPGTGSFQPNGEPLYDGVQSSWVAEEMFLNGLTSQQNKLKFELKTDGSVTRDGWYIDDISVYIYAAVPVELSSFNALVSDNKVHLSWTTSSELNNKGFEVQRKTPDKNSDWKEIGFVKGAGTTTELINYSFIDEAPLRGTILYRLKQIDYDGSFKIYPSVMIEFNLPEKFVLNQNYPNPFNPSTKISWQSPVSGQTTLKVYDILGREVATLVNEYKEAGIYEVEFNVGQTFSLSSLSSGVYFYKLTVGGFTEVKKMILSK